MNSPTDIMIDVQLVKKLIHRQFPQWSKLSITPVQKSGWDNRTFHLGEKMLVRLPSAEAYAPQVIKEHKWLPVLAPLLPVSIPIPLAMGQPDCGYSWHWSVYQWLDGVTACLSRIADLSKFAQAVANFLLSLHKIDGVDGPVAGPDNFYRGGSLKYYDQETRHAIASYVGVIAKSDMLALWEIALASRWQKSPVWVHGDMAMDNLLLQEGQLSAVIDFGQLAVGDPACDLALAWTLFEGESRDIFRNTLSLDSDTWMRARGWVLWKTLCAPVAGTDTKSVLENLFDDYKLQNYSR